MNSRHCFTAPQLMAVVIGLSFFTGSARADIVLDDFSQATQPYAFTLPSMSTTVSTNLGVNAGLGGPVSRSVTLSLLNINPNTPPSQFFQYGVSGTVGGGNFRAATASDNTTASAEIRYTFAATSLSGLTANLWLPRERNDPFQVRVWDASGNTASVSGITTGAIVPGTGLTAAADYSVSFTGLSGVNLNQINQVALTLNAFSSELFVDTVRIETAPTAVPAPPALLLVLCAAPVLIGRIRRKL